MKTVSFTPLESAQLRHDCACEQSDAARYHRYCRRERLRSARFYLIYYLLSALLGIGIFLLANVR